MTKTSLSTLVEEQLTAARDSGSGRSAHTVYGGHQHSLRQTIIALTAGTALADHESPGDATLQVLHGHVRLTSVDAHCDAAAGDHVVIPPCRHGLEAVDDSVVMLTVVKSVRPEERNP
ncbi:MAG TPA: LuxR family transcriptional regulator [Mycobacterium sp.]|nr:LuxR family transcriptional regulator [Mycobacterium sp.]